MQELQNDIDHLTGWSDKQQLKFNTSKCKVLYIGAANKSPCSMLDLNDHKHKKVEFIEEKKCLGVIFDDNSKFCSRIINQVNKANWLMRLMRRSYTYLDKHRFCYLFNALVRPHLEYCVYVWYSNRDIIQVINHWNNFPFRVAYAASLDSFKLILDNTWSEKKYKFQVLTN